MSAAAVCEGDHLMVSVVPGIGVAPAFDFGLYGFSRERSGSFDEGVAVVREGVGLVVHGVSFLPPCISVSKGGSCRSASMARTFSEPFHATCGLMK